jgi:hypothetical protein
MLIPQSFSRQIFMFIHIQYYVGCDMLPWENSLKILRTTFFLEKEVCESPVINMKNITNMMSITMHRKRFIFRIHGSYDYQGCQGRDL